MAYANRRDTLPQVTANDLVREPVLLEKPGMSVQK